jgi:serine/threonine protein phosphatase PrpC
LVQKLANQLGEDFQRLKGKNLEKKFLTWLSKKIQEKNLKVKFAIKEEMESSKFGIF